MKKRHTPAADSAQATRQAHEELAAGAAPIPEVAPGSSADQRGDLPPLEESVRRREGRDAMKRLKEPEKENARPKKIVADQALDIRILEEVSRKNFRA